MFVQIVRRVIISCVFVLSITELFSQDSTQFVGRIWYLQNTGEFYTTLNFIQGVDKIKATKDLIKNVDSLVTKEYYLSRKAIKPEVIQKYFDIKKFDEIIVFNQSHEQIAKARFKRVEYYEDMIDGMFIAIFEPEKIEESQQNELIFYGISSSLQTMIIEKFSHEEITKNALDKNIKEYIKFNKEGMLKSKHLDIKQSPINKVSILSIEDLEELTFSSYLLEHQGSKINILKQLNEDYVFWDLLPVPLLIHKKPVFIVEIIIPESDFTGYMLAVYNGTEYILQEEMEVKI